MSLRSRSFPSNGGDNRQIGHSTGNLRRREESVLSGFGCDGDSGKTI